MRRALVLYSGGKDSHYSLLLSYYHGIIPEALVIAVPNREDSWLFHGVNVSWAKLHGELMGLRVHAIPVSGVKDVEDREFKEGLAKVLGEHEETDYVITGAVKSRYQLERFKSIAEDLGLRLYAPLWEVDELELLRREMEMLAFVITAVQAYCLDLSVLGRPSSPRIYSALLRAHRECGISLVGEGGEFETFVIRSPMFKGRGIAIRKARKEVFPFANTGYYVIEDAAIL